jgi:acetoin utilization protein AcuB
MRLNEVMTTRVETTTSDQSADQAWEQMRFRRIRHLVVMRGNDIVGVLSERDLGGAHGEDVRRGRTVDDLMNDAVVTASPATTVRDAANLLRGHTIGCLPVVDRGKLVGIVTVSDLLDLLGRGSVRPIAESVRWIMRGRGWRVKHPAG